MSMLDSSVPAPAFELLFNEAPHPYLALAADAAFTIVAVNERYLQATGTVREDIVGRGLFDVFPDNPDDASGSAVSDLRASLLRVIQDRRQDVMGVQKYDIPLRDGSGRFELKYWSPVNTPVLGKDGRVVNIIHHVEDVTEFVLSRERTRQENDARIEKVAAHAERMEAEVLHRATEVKEANRALKVAMDKLEQREEELSRLNERLTELDRAKTEFFSNVSHEFRTPLTLMLGPLEEELAEEAAPLPSARRERLEAAHRNSLRLLKLVNTLLTFAQVEAGRFRACFEPTDLAGYTADIASTFRSVVETGGLAFTVACPPLPEPVLVDREMWEKVVLNLVSNAFKHTFVGSIRVEVDWSGAGAELRVIDTGEGIPSEEIPRLFDRFHRIRGARSRIREGSGIGLALVKEIVTAHGGTIEVHSEVGQGSTFTVKIPSGHAHLPADQIRFHASAPASVRGAQPYVLEAQHWLAAPAANIVPEAFEAPDLARARGRILLADDNADMRAYIQRLLSDYYQVVAVPDGESALASAFAFPPDLVLSDIMMPGIDGIALLRALREEPATRLVPVVLLSARAGESSAVEGLDAGADDYLVKPFSARELLARVRANLELGRMRREGIEELEKRVAERTRELVQTNTALARAQAVAERANDAKSRFLAAASHDLRQPLTALSLYASVMGSHVAPGGQQLLRSLRDCVGSLGRLLNDLLDFSKLEAGVISPSVSDFRLADVLSSLVADHRAEAQLKDIDLRWAPTAAIVHTDPTLYQRILANFIENAVRYTPRGRVLVGRRRRGGKSWVEVWDTGIGIPEDKTAEIFEEFTQLGDEARTRGSGLGLTIAKRTAALLGLEIRVRSWPGRGSLFAVELPCRQVELESRPARPQPMQRSLRVALVEDNEMVRTALAFALQARGYEVLAAASGEELQCNLGHQHPDVLVSDYRLTRGETGFDVIALARARMGKELPAILITGDTDPRLVRTMADRGIVVIHKPLDLEALQACLTELAPA